MEPTYNIQFVQFVHMLFFVLLVVSLIIQTMNCTFNFNAITAYAQDEQMKIQSEDSIKIHKIETKKINVGDIDIAYKIFGNGTPILLINGLSAPLDFWDPIFLETISHNHTIITFDNRGIGNTTVGEKIYSIKQFADDAAALLDALKINKVDVLGWSMGGMIAQEMALKHPDKIEKLIIYASTCGGKGFIFPDPFVMKAFTSHYNTQMERWEQFLPLLFPEKWRMQNPNYFENLPTSTEIISDISISRQIDAIINWQGTCDELHKVSQETLVIVGTDDILTVPANSKLISDKIPGASLVEIQGGGHASIMQYPEEFSQIVLAFLK